MISLLGVSKDTRLKKIQQCINKNSDSGISKLIRSDMSYPQVQNLILMALDKGSLKTAKAMVTRLKTMNGSHTLGSDFANYDDFRSELNDLLRLKAKSYTEELPDLVSFYYEELDHNLREDVPSVLLSERDIHFSYAITQIRENLIDDLNFHSNVGKWMATALLHHQEGVLELLSMIKDSGTELDLVFSEEQRAGISAIDLRLNNKKHTRALGLRL